MKYLLAIVICICFFPWQLYSQFAPAASEIGSKAIAKDSSILVAWATHCTLQRGPMDISQLGLGLATAGIAAHALGPAGDGFIVSLGDGGQAVLTFAHPIENGLGADFAVFENAFNNTFLELAFVEVSSDGQHFVRFPAVSNTDTSTPVGSFGAVDPRKIYNLAGKYRANYGTPFDLEELRGLSPLLDINAVTHVRLIDVVGSLQNAYATRDSRGHKINDPWNTPFASGGFDLDAVGVIHQTQHNNIHQLAKASSSWFPNPLPQGKALQYKALQVPDQLAVYNMLGQVIWQTQQPQLPLALPSLQPGSYQLLFWVNNQAFYQTIVIL
ncbi:MAG: T9SS type A sorting domain-containing protein [Aureispira sp.]